LGRESGWPGFVGEISVESVDIADGGGRGAFAAGDDRDGSRFHSLIEHFG
jgi:hypothetical protein